MATTDVQGLRRELERKGTQAAASPWARRSARFGLLCRGIVYAVLAGLALLAAAGMGGRTTDTRGAIATLAREPFGAAIVATLGLGFVALGLWYLVDAILDPRRRRSGAKGVALRLGRAAAGFVHLALAALCARIALGAGASSSSGDSRAQSLTASVLALPFGRVLVAAGAVVALAVAGYQVKKALQARRGEKLEGSMGPKLRRWAPRLGLAGYAARGVVVALIGAFLLVAALNSDPREAVGFDGALAALARQPYGMALLGAAALGLLAFAAYSAIEARYKRL
jgi:hypothetical protein